MKTADITLVFQGVFKPWVTREREDFARNIALTRKVLPGARIVLSTWEGVDLPRGLRLDGVVESADPGALAPLKLDDRKPNNINRQLATTQAGLAAVTTPYVAKLRTDCFLEHAGFLDYYLEQRALDGGRERLLASSFFTLDPTLFERLPYHISDWFHFGPTELVRAYWSAPPMSMDDAQYHEIHPHAPGSSVFERRFRARCAVEQHICTAFAAGLGYACPRFLNDLSDTVLDDYRRFLAQEMMLLDPWQIGLRFDKYGWVGGSLFQRLNNLMFLDWAALLDDGLRLCGPGGRAELHRLIDERQRQKAMARVAFRHTSALHAMLFDPARPHHPVRRLASGIARRLVRA
jgi:hypothetical protein